MLNVVVFLKNLYEYELHILTKYEPSKPDQMTLNKTIPIVWMNW